MEMFCPTYHKCPLPDLPELDTGVLRDHPLPLAREQRSTIPLGILDNYLPCRDAIRTALPRVLEVAHVMLCAMPAALLIPERLGQDESGLQHQIRDLPSRLQGLQFLVPLRLARAIERDPVDD